MDMRAYYDSEISEHFELVSKIREEIYDQFANLVSACVAAIRRYTGNHQKRILSRWIGSPRWAVASGISLRIEQAYRW